VVHAAENDLWVLAHGSLHRLYLALDTTGRKLVQYWAESLNLGSPLHASQVDASGSLLFLVTYSPDRRQCLATAVHAETGKIEWQRQLGLTCVGQPLPLGGEVLALDQSGGVFSFPPPARSNGKKGTFYLGGRQLAAGFDQPQRFSSLKALSPTEAYHVAVSENGTTATVRRFAVDPQTGKVAHDPQHDERVQEFNSPVVGAPALGPGGVLLPQEDGTTARVPLPPNKGLGNGPDWRTTRLTGDVQPQLEWADDQRFLATEGGSGLAVWNWPAKAGFTPVPRDRDPGAPNRALRARVVAPPVVLSAQPRLRVCAADATGAVTLLEGDGLEEKRRWELGGRITAGPFPRGAHLGCVVDKRSLVWIDPEKDQPLWKYDIAGEAIVGRPQLLGDVVVVADQSGRFVALDAATGRPKGKGYELKGSLAPAAAPSAFGPGQAFAPLTDGTVLILSLEDLLQ
jgi:hypothetical protein